jgi:hypothetical protein
MLQALVRGRLIEADGASCSGMIATSGTGALPRFNAAPWMHDADRAGLRVKPFIR